MAIFNTQNRLLIGKNEAQFGVPETLDPAVDSDVRVRGLELSTLSVEYDDESSKYFDGTLTHDMAIAGISRGTIDFNIKIAAGEFPYNAGVLGTPLLPYEKYIKSAGHVVEVSTPTDCSTEDGYWKFHPNNSELCTTSTVAIYDITNCDTKAGIEYKLGGAMASSFSISAESAGKPYMMAFSMNGKVVDVIEVEGADIPEYNEDGSLHTIADKMLNTTIRITQLNDDGTVVTPNVVDTYESDGATPLTSYDIDGNVITVYDTGNSIQLYDDSGNKITAYDDNSNEITDPRNGKVSNDFCSNSFNLDSGLTLTEIICQQDSSGLLGYQITGRDERVTIEPLLEKLSDFDFWEALNSEQPYKLEILGQKLEITVPYAQIISSDGSDDNGLRRLAITMRPLKNVQGANSDERQAVYTVKIYGDNTGTCA